MKAFDFSHPDFLKTSAEAQSLLRKAFRGEMTKSEFVEAWTQIPHKRGHYTYKGKRKIRSRSHRNGATVAYNVAEKLQYNYGCPWKDYS